MVVKYCVLHIYIRQKQNTVNQTVRNIMKIVIFLYSFLKKCTYKLQEQDFPCGPVVENPSASEEDMGLIFGLGGFYMLQGNWTSLCSDNYWSLHALRAHEPQLLSLHALEPLLCNKRSLWGVCAPQLEKASKQQGRPRTVINNKSRKILVDKIWYV